VDARLRPATATGDDDACEVVLYLTLHDAVRRSGETAWMLADMSPAWCLWSAPSTKVAGLRRVRAARVRG